MKMQKISICLLLTSVALFAGCPNPDKKADEVFTAQGINRIRKPNDYMQPGAVVIVKDKNAIYADNMLDYLEGKPDKELPIMAGTAVIPATTNNTAMTAEIAIKFLDSLLPVKASGKMNLTSNVKLEMVNAKIKRIKIVDMGKFLGWKESIAFREAMLSNISQKRDVYLAYETYQTNHLKLTAEAGNDISASAEVGKIQPLFEGIEPKFTWKKTSKTEISIEGDSPYVFAIRTAKLTWDEKKKKFDFDITKFNIPGVLSTGTDIQYSAALIGDSSLDFKAVDIQRRSPSDDLARPR